MLKFDQKDRMDVRMLLLHPIFDPVRNNELEQLSPKYINSEIEEFNNSNPDFRQIIIDAAFPRN